MSDQIFSNHELQKLFDENGYVVVDAFSEEVLSKFNGQYERLEGKTNTPFESTMNNQSVKHKQLVHELVVSHFQEIIDAQLNDFIPVTGNFVVKQSDNQSVVNAHQDWCITDESAYRGLNIWVPFVDTNEENGAIYIVKGSHLLPKAKRGSFVPTYFDEKLFTNYRDFTPVFMRAGQALIYDLRCIHASPPNVSGVARVAAGCAVAPKAANLIHYLYVPESKQLLTYDIKPEFFLSYSYLNKQFPITTQPKSVEDNFLPTVYEQHIQQALFKCQRIHGKWFVDETLQSKYEQDGYVVVDCFDTTEVAEILTFFKANTQWFKEGFLSSVYAPDKHYREAVDEFLTPYANKIVSRFMKDFKVVISSFMAKGVGKQSAMYPHQDWSIVDETRFSSFNIWIPLIDVNYNNGSLYIMKGSHKLPLSYRGSNVPDALTDYAAFNENTLTYLPMKAGQALIYDHRCIHASAVNRSKIVRPACSINIAPANAEVIHCFYDKKNGVLQKYAADKNFFFEQVIRQSEKPPINNLLSKQSFGEVVKFKERELNFIFQKQLVRKQSAYEKIVAAFTKKH